MSPRKRIRSAPQSPPPATPRMVEDAIAATLVYFSVLDTPITEADLLDREMFRDPYVIRVKALLMYFLKTECHMSYVAIGNRFERDHTSVLNLVRRVHDLFGPDEIPDIVEYVKMRVAKQAVARHEAMMAEMVG